MGRRPAILAIARVSVAATAKKVTSRVVIMLCSSVVGSPHFLSITHVRGRCMPLSPVPVLPPRVPPYGRPCTHACHPWHTLGCHPKSQEPGRQEPTARDEGWGDQPDDLISFKGGSTS
jgi:hypothetical protein